jgi:hypothetical protein
MTRNRRRRLVLAAVVAVMLAVAAYGFTATNTVPGSNAGDGSGTIAGYTVSNIAYTLNTTDPTKVDKVAFTLSAAATSVKAKAVASGSTYQDCTVTGGTSVSCDWPTASEPTVASVDQLRVIAVS